MSLETDFLTGLKSVIEMRGEKITPLSKRAGMGETAVRDMFRKGSVPRVSNAKALADALNVTIDDLFRAGKGILPGNTPHPQQTFASIPRYDAHLSAGHGAMNSEQAEILDYIPFTNEFVEEKLGRNNVDGLIACYVHGESMATTLNDGDLALIDTSRVDLRAGIYALNYGNESYVKRVEKHDQWYSLVSDNRAYPPQVIAGEDLRRLHIIGKVIWSGGVHK